MVPNSRPPCAVFRPLNSPSLRFGTHLPCSAQVTKKILECIQTLPITWALLLESITLVKMSKKLRKKKYSKDIATRKLANDIYISLQALQPAEVLAHQSKRLGRACRWRRGRCQGAAVGSRRDAQLGVVGLSLGRMGGIRYGIVWWWGKRRLSAWLSLRKEQYRM